MDTLIGTLKNQGRKVTCRPGEWLFQSGDPADGLYLVTAGEIRITKMDEQGKEIEVVRLGPGDFFGEAILFVSPEFPAFAQAVRESDVVFLDKDSLFRSLETVPGLARDLLTLLARKCLVLNRRIEALNLQTVRQRLIRFLLSHCHGERSCTVRLDIKKAELAQLLGTISETLSRNLKQLQESGLIEVEGRSFHIPDRTRLRAELSR